MYVCVYVITSIFAHPPAAGIDYRVFNDTIVIFPGGNYTFSPDGNPLYCSYQYYVVIDDVEVENTNFEFFFLEISPIGVAIETQVFGSLGPVFIIDDDSKCHSYLISDCSIHACPHDPSKLSTVNSAWYYILCINL